MTVKSRRDLIRETVLLPSTRQWASLILILAFAVVIRVRYFIGFGLGDDMGYVNLANMILNGVWPDYHYLNVYVFRPLLLLSVAASFKLLGTGDVAFILPVFLSAIGSIVVAYGLGRLMFDHRVGLWAAFLLAIYPFNVYNSVTFVNDIIISFVAGIAVLFFFKAKALETRNNISWYAMAGFALVVSYLFKITSLVFLGVFGLFSAFEMIVQHKNLKQIAFYGSFAFFFFLILVFYKLNTGEFFRHFHAEKYYFNTNIPDYYLSGAFSPSDMLLQYPRHLFLPLIQGHRRFFEFGLYFYFFVPAFFIFLWKNENRTAGFFLIWWIILVFSFLEFMPSNRVPFYLPIPRQERYLEIITLPVIVIIGWFFARLSHKTRLLTLMMAVILLSASLYDIHMRCQDAKISIADLKAASKWLCNHKAKQVYIDGAGMPHIAFHSQRCKVSVININEAYKAPPPKGAYIVSGGSRMFLWDFSVIQVVDKDRISVALEKVLEYKEVDTPKKKGPLTIYRCGDLRK